MPLLYDAYGRPINEPDITPPAGSQSKGKLARAIRRLRAWFLSLKPLWQRALEILGLLSFFLAVFSIVLLLRQEILVEPYISYDLKEAFLQQFTITNNGPFDIYDVHYACAISSALLENGSSPLPSKAIIQMVPVFKPNITRLQWKQKTNTECDFITYFGPQLRSANIEVLVSYKRWLKEGEIETGQQFSGKRDAAGNFQWVYGSSDPSVREPPAPNSPKKAVIMVPF